MAIKKTHIQISVGDLIHYIYRGGDLDARYTSRNRALQGTKAHQVIQKSMDENYASEVKISYLYEEPSLEILLTGRIDGIFLDTIDEIKSTLRPLSSISKEDYPMHWLQGELYAFMYAKENNLKEMTVQLTYVSVENYESKRFSRNYDYESLKAIFNRVIDEYLEFAHRMDDWKQLASKSLEILDFPFDGYRNGQRALAVCSYKTIRENKKSFIQAPTGIGKTVSTLFPALKAMGEGHLDKIFYLTAKTITRSVAEETLEIMKKKGLRVKSLTITAKDKICFEKDAACIPEECSYAKGHYNRINDAMTDLMDHQDSFVRETLESYAKKHHVCPFEFSLDMALMADVIICDYNYVFDPRVKLKRFFAEKKDKFGFLIDEAHNLVDRARGMYSSVIEKKPLLEIKKLLKYKKEEAEVEAFLKTVDKYNKALLSYKKSVLEKDVFVDSQAPNDLYGPMMSFMSRADVILNDYKDIVGYDLILDTYFQTLNFLNISELYDERYVTYTTFLKGDVQIHLFCVDPSYLLNECVSVGTGTVFFSATLSPMPYFHRLYSFEEKDYTLMLPSPFHQDHRRYMYAKDIQTTYKNRAYSYENIALYLKAFASQEVGNYMVFFSSYAYKEKVIEIFKSFESEITILDQDRDQNEGQKDEFLKTFVHQPEKSLLAFCVLGSSFSEGIDLKGSRLIGTAIVGVGLPMVGLEREIIKNYHENHGEAAFDYAYVYPGLNKIMQAAGRVIRTEEDRGMILLLDERYGYNHYKKLLPRDWAPRGVTLNNFKEVLNQEWKHIKKNEKQL
jgi:DNA excision repair protein ERCC-2